MPPIFTGNDHLDHIFQLVINDACDLMRPYILSDYLALRNALRLCCPQMKELVDSHAPFWNRFVFSPRTTVDAFTAIRKRLYGMPLEITLRITRDSGLDLRSPSILEDTVERFMARAYGDLSSMFPICRKLTLEAASLPVLEIMLQTLSPIHTDSLRTFVLVYPDPIGGLVVPSCVSDFVFDEPGDACVPYLVPRLACLRPAALQRSPSVVSILSPVGGSFALTTLILDGVNFADVPQSVIAGAPLPNLTTLDVRFRGRMPMGRALMHLNLPRFHTLVFRCDTIGDLRCFLSCMPLFAVRARSFRLVNDRRSTFAFKAFLATSSDLFSNPATDACPALAEFSVRAVHIKSLVDLVRLENFDARTWFELHAPHMEVRLPYA
ncbi:hypothetical protein DFH06DRAFT_1339217 [Mycena polygramma]|nr:hypothetical protein DFH06DRAFT_1339217 [Mycena polygramma]